MTKSTTRFIVPQKSSKRDKGGAELHQLTLTNVDACQLGLGASFRLALNSVDSHRRRFLWLIEIEKEKRRRIKKSEEIEIRRKTSKENKEERKKQERKRRRKGE